MGTGPSRDATACSEEQQRIRMRKILRHLSGGALDEAVQAVGRRSTHIFWSRLPEKIILVRHGESEGNVDKAVYMAKGDSMLELTPRGLQQAEEAGRRLKEIVGSDEIFVVASPFERVQQTLLGLYRGGFPEQQVGRVHVSAQMREQEFGNFQAVGVGEKAKAQAERVGRFYYRRDNGESSADVYDRVSAFWDELLRDILPGQERHFGTCLMVTHGLTMRLLLMKIFQWSVETFETVFNGDNCEHITLVKDMERQTYNHCPERSLRGRLPWATRKIWVVMTERQATAETEEKLKLLKEFSSSPAMKAVNEAVKTTSMGEIDEAIDELENKRMLERSDLYTVMDYLTLQQPRTDQREELNGRLMPGHGLCQEAELAEGKGVHLKWEEEVEFVDWWGSLMSYQGKMLRRDNLAQRVRFPWRSRRSSCNFATGSQPLAKSMSLLDLL